VRDATYFVLEPLESFGVVILGTDGFGGL
jgi:hypothetical protein